MEMARVEKLRNIPEVLLDWAKTSWIDKIDWIIRTVHISCQTFLDVFEQMEMANVLNGQPLRF